jgi:hypothetical protein
MTEIKYGETYYKCFLLSKARYISNISFSRPVCYCPHADAIGLNLVFHLNTETETSL